MKYYLLNEDVPFVATNNSTGEDLDLRNTAFSHFFKKGSVVGYDDTGHIFPVPDCADAISNYFGTSRVVYNVEEELYSHLMPITDKSVLDRITESAERIGWLEGEKAFLAMEKSTNTAPIIDFIEKTYQEYGSADEILPGISEMIDILHSDSPNYDLMIKLYCQEMSGTYVDPYNDNLSYDISNRVADYLDADRGIKNYEASINLEKEAMQSSLDGYLHSLRTRMDMISDFYRENSMFENDEPDFSDLSRVPLDTVYGVKMSFDPRVEYAVSYYADLYENTLLIGDEVSNRIYAQIPDLESALPVLEQDLSLNSPFKDISEHAFITPEFIHSVELNFLAGSLAEYSRTYDTYHYRDVYGYDDHSAETDIAHDLEDPDRRKGIVTDMKVTLADLEAIDDNDQDIEDHKLTLSRLITRIGNFYSETDRNVWFVIDTETTINEDPKDKSVPDVTEISLLKLDEYNNIIGEYDSLVNLGHPMNDRTREFNEKHGTGISDETLSKAPSPEQVAKEVAEFIGNEPYAVIGHNVIQFDNPIVANFLKKYADFDYAPTESYDTLLASRKLYYGGRDSGNDVPSHRLVDMYDYFKDSDNPIAFHRSIDDCKATLQVYKNIKPIEDKFDSDLSKTVVGICRIGDEDCLTRVTQKEFGVAHYDIFRISDLGKGFMSGTHPMEEMFNCGRLPVPGDMVYFPENTKAQIYQILSCSNRKDIYDFKFIDTNEHVYDFHGTTPPSGFIDYTHFTPDKLLHRLMNEPMDKAVLSGDLLIADYFPPKNPKGMLDKIYRNEDVEFKSTSGIIRTENLKQFKDFVAEANAQKNMSYNKEEKKADKGVEL